MPSTPKHIRTLQRPSHTPSTLHHAKYAQTHQDTTETLTHPINITPCQVRPNTSGHYRDPHTHHQHYTMPRMSRDPYTPHQHFTIPGTSKHIRTPQRSSHTPPTLHHAKDVLTHQDTTETLTHPTNVTPCQGCPNTSGHYRDPHTPHQHYTMPSTPKHIRTLQRPSHTPPTLHHAKDVLTHQDTTETLTHPTNVTPCQGCPNTSGHYRDPHTPHQHYTMPSTPKHIRTLQRPSHTPSTLHHAKDVLTHQDTIMLLHCSEFKSPYTDPILLSERHESFLTKIFPSSVSSSSDI